MPPTQDSWFLYLCVYLQVVVGMTDAQATAAHERAEAMAPRGVQHHIPNAGFVVNTTSREYLRSACVSEAVSCQLSEASICALLAVRCRFAFCLPFGVVGFSTLRPHNDLGTGLYLNQYQGGPVSNGSNTMHATHATAALTRAAGMTPLNTLGQPDPNGKFVMLSIGMSNTSQNVRQRQRNYLAVLFTHGTAARSSGCDHTKLVLFNGARVVDRIHLGSDDGFNYRGSPPSSRRTG